MAGLFKVVPKVGPMRAIDFKEPTPRTEDLYFKSVNKTIDSYGQALRDVESKGLETPNIDLDTGKPTRRGEYPLADATFRELLDEQTAQINQLDNNEALRENIENFYQGFGFPKEGTRIDRRVAARWRKTWLEVSQVRAAGLLLPAARVVQVDSRPVHLVEHSRPSPVPGSR